jgi:iron complex transport system ATP-binding protein
MNAITSCRTTVLACDDLCVGYGDKAILKHVHLTCQAGCFTSLLGPNGVGKTTLLRTLSRHLPPLSGSIEIMGRQQSSLRQGELARIMAVVLTDRVTPPLFSVFQFVALGRYPHTDFLGRLTTSDRQVVDAALAAVHARDLMEREFASLSDGERQKVLVARALAQEPQILLLDEPTAHLDLKHRVEVMTILRNLCRSRGIAVIASLHDVDIAAKVSDQVVLVKQGAISAWGSPEEVLDSAAVASLYDFDTACFDAHLGSIELRGDGQRGRVFVVAGMGSGAPLYRLLSKRGFAISTGVLQSNDLDCYVARSLGAECAQQPPDGALDQEQLDLAGQALNGCDWVIDAGFAPAGPYGRNLDLLRQAAEVGKPILTLRDGGLEPLLGSAGRAAVVFTQPAQLLDAMEAQS